MGQYYHQTVLNLSQLILITFSNAFLWNTCLCCGLRYCSLYLWFMDHYCPLGGWDLGKTRLITAFFELFSNCPSPEYFLISILKLELWDRAVLWRATSGIFIQPLEHKIWFLEQLPTHRYPFTQLGSWYRDSVYTWKLSHFPFTSKGASKDPYLQNPFSCLFL